MIIKIHDYQFKVKKGPDDPEVASSSAFFHTFMMELKDAGIDCKVVNLDRCSCIFGVLDRVHWLICEDIGINARELYNSGKTVTCIFSGTYIEGNKIKKILEAKGKL